MRTASFLHQDTSTPPGPEVRLQSGRIGSGNGADDCTDDFQTLLDPPRKRTHLKGECPGPGWATCPAQPQIRSCSPPARLTHHRKTPNKRIHSVKQDSPPAAPWTATPTHILILVRMSARAGFIFPNLGSHADAHMTDYVQSPPLPACTDSNSTHPHPFPGAIPPLRARESPPEGGGCPAASTHAGINVQAGKQ